jgi:hypothetical protein
MKLRSLLVKGYTKIHQHILGNTAYIKLYMRFYIVLKHGNLSFKNYNKIL